MSSFIDTAEPGHARATHRRLLAGKALPYGAVGSWRAAVAFGSGARHEVKGYVCRRVIDKSAANVRLDSAEVAVGRDDRDEVKWRSVRLV